MSPTDGRSTIGITITVRLFAILRERAATGTVRVTVQEGATAGEAAEAAADATGIRDVFDAVPVAFAVNRTYAGRDTPLRDGDEVAVIPPVSGGAGARVTASVGEGPISLDTLTEAVADPHAGATVTFVGTTRTIGHLDYEGYAEMAEPLLGEILHEVATAHRVIAIAARHRLGRVARGQASIVIAVSAGHRPEAFAAARAAIDRVKAELPIWKREIDGDTATWVAGTPVERQR